MEEWFGSYRKLLFKLAYQMTGSAADAEDVVQDVFVKLHDMDRSKLTEPKAYLCRMVTNRCLDLQKSARARRERYVGPWLPEPVDLADESFGSDPAEAAAMREMLSYGMLVLLERLSPLERAVFVLREALGFEYPDIARMLGRQEPACRKLMSRARAKLGIEADMPLQVKPADETWVAQFVAGLASGQIDRVVSMLAEDIVLVSDGGGKAIAAVQPIETPVRVARFLLGLAAKEAPDGAYGLSFGVVNGQTAVLIREGGELKTVVMCDVRDGRLVRCYFVRNPDKLSLLARSVQTER